MSDLLTESGPIGAVGARLAGEGAKPVRALYFDKSPEVNWALAWHQDRTISVKSRVDVPGFGPWTVKRGLLHVAPPAEVLARLVTLRVHLDDVDSGNGPLLVAPGSHRFGRVDESAIESFVERCGAYACHATAGDVWAYSTLILHASESSRLQRRRRVLQLDYAATELPNGLQWLDLMDSC